MAHLIDKDALVAEIEKQKQLIFPQNTGEMKVADVPKPLEQGWLNALSWIKKTIDTLEVKEMGVDLGDPKGDKSAKHIIDTKTLEVKEVDFEKELDRIWFDNKLGNYFDNDALDFAHIRTLCKHFYELGLSVSNSTKVAIPDIDDVLKENGVNPDSKEAKIIKESYFMAIEKLTQKGEEV